MSILLFKLTAGPLLIALVTLVTRRFGPSAGGWLVGLPLTSGPISVFLALEQGTDYAATAAITSLVGAGTVSLFCLVYALCAARFSRLMTLGAALTGYLASVGVLSHIPFTIGTGLAALVVMDAVTRLLPGALGDEMSAEDESFSAGSGLLEYAQYTRPSSFRGMGVPEVLLSGDHARVDAWRRQSAIERTARWRPDLLESASLTDDERSWARELVEREEGSL